MSAPSGLECPESEGSRVVSTLFDCGLTAATCDGALADALGDVGVLVVVVGVGVLAVNSAVACGDVMVSVVESSQATGNVANELEMLVQPGSSRNIQSQDPV